MRQKLAQQVSKQKLGEPVEYFRHGIRPSSLRPASRDCITILNVLLICKFSTFLRVVWEVLWWIPSPPTSLVHLPTPSHPGRKKGRRGKKKQNWIIWMGGWVEENLTKLETERTYYKVRSMWEEQTSRESYNSDANYIALFSLFLFGQPPPPPARSPPAQSPPPLLPRQRRATQPNLGRRWQRRKRHRGGMGWWAETRQRGNKHGARKSNTNNLSKSHYILMWMPKWLISAKLMRRASGFQVQRHN